MFSLSLFKTDILNSLSERYSLSDRSLSLQGWSLGSLFSPFDEITFSWMFSILVDICIWLNTEGFIYSCLHSLALLVPVLLQRAFQEFKGYWVLSCLSCSHCSHFSTRGYHNPKYAITGYPDLIHVGKRRKCSGFPEPTLFSLIPPSIRSLSIYTRLPVIGGEVIGTPVFITAGITVMLI